MCREVLRHEVGEAREIGAFRHYGVEKPGEACGEAGSLARQ